jgi:hypothetical protein
VLPCRRDTLILKMQRKDVVMPKRERSPRDATEN